MNYCFDQPDVPPSYTHLIQPLSQIFISREEAEWAFDLLASALEYLGVTELEDQRFAITLPDDGHTLNLVFGKWVVLHFTGPGYAKFRVGLALQEEHLDIMGPYTLWDPFTTDDDISISSLVHSPVTGMS